MPTELRVACMAAILGLASFLHHPGVAHSRAHSTTPQPKARIDPIGNAHKVKGTATWYCLPGVSRCHRDYGPGPYAAAGAELRVGKWRGRTVTVCYSGECIRVKLVDWCACKGDRIIDLYGYAFKRLAPLSRGTLRGVTVSW